MNRLLQDADKYVRPMLFCFYQLNLYSGRKVSQWGYSVPNYVIESEEQNNRSFVPLNLWSTAAAYTSNCMYMIVVDRSIVEGFLIDRIRNRKLIIFLGSL